MAKQFPIYIVEDDEDDLLLLRYCLQRSQVRIPFEFQGNGEAFITFLQSNPEARSKTFIVLLDLKMPRIDGFEVLAWLKKQTDFSQNPVVILSSSNLQEDVQKAYALGANWYIQKPRTLEEYQVMIQRLVHFCEEISLSSNEFLS
jgi:CheY-like chemotaxis protein